VILAGGPGSRIGGSKPTVGLHGRPLLHYPLDAMRAVLPEVAVISKADVLMPPLEGAMLWIEPDRPGHPLLGVVEALDLAGGRPVLICPMDFPFVTPELLGRLAAAPFDGRSAVAAASHGVAQPLLACYRPAAGPLLWKAMQRESGPQDAVATLQPVLLEVADELELFDVDTPEDLLLAAAMLDRQRREHHLDQPKVKS
jgi:molybdenum cofactor guanylyltransferase